jgi:prepilin-type N-terminal cleavage/methylation domain-containing protein
MSSRAIGRRIGEERGVTLIEMLVTVLILGIILGGMTTLFMSASTSEINQTNRHEAQQSARLALEALRREIHCASLVVPNAVPGSSVTITFGSYCPTFIPGQPLVTWCTQEIVNSKRYALWRYPGPSPASCGVTGTTGRTQRADRLTTGQVFNSYAPPDSVNRTLAQLGVILPVDVTPQDAGQRFTLTDKISIRNGGRG